MREVILQEFVSIDGLVAGPNNSVDFIPASTQGDLTFGQEQLALMDTIDTLLLGRVTYGEFAGFWPSQLPTAALSRASSRPPKLKTNPSTAELPSATWMF